MTKKQVWIGSVYWAKVSEKIVKVRILCASPFGGWDALNLETDRRVRIKTAGRLRGPA